MILTVGRVQLQSCLTVPLLVFDTKGAPATRRERIEAAVEAGGKHLKDSYEAWITTDPFRAEPFWSMIRAGVSAHEAAEIYGRLDDESPVWCAQRFGQSLTFLPGGRVIQIAGEHEDSYDQDFCIYNDVFVHETDGVIHIFGYPEAVFPPTDFHTATLIGEDIYLIGSLGYLGARHYGTTPVYRLDTKTLRIDRLATTGDAPGWIYEHRAVQIAPDEIRVFRGKIVTRAGEKEAHTANQKSFILDVKRLAWRVDV